MKKKFSVCLLAVLTAIVCLAFAACSKLPANVKEANAKMEKAGYSSNVTTWRYFGYVEGANIENDSGEKLSVLYFEKADYAEQAYEDLKQTKETETITVKQEGKCVYFGTANAISEFEK